LVQLSPLYHPALRLAPWRALADDDLGKAGDEEVVWKSLDAAGGQLRPLATQRTRELACSVQHVDYHHHHHHDHDHAYLFKTATIKVTVGYTL